MFVFYVLTRIYKRFKREFSQKTTANGEIKKNERKPEEEYIHIQIL